VINAIESLLYITKNAVRMLGKQAVRMGNIDNWLRIMSSGELRYAVLNLLVQLQRLSLAHWKRVTSYQLQGLFSNFCCLYRCPVGNVPDFGRMFLKLKYTNITQNTYIRSWTVTEIMAIEKCGLLAVLRTVPVPCDVLPVHCACPSFSLQPGQAHSRCDLVSKVVTITVNCEEL